MAHRHWLPAVLGSITIQISSTIQIGSAALSPAWARPTPELRGRVGSMDEAVAAFDAARRIVEVARVRHGL